MSLPEEIEGLQVIGTCKEKSDIEYQGDWSRATSYLLLTDGEKHYICFSEGYAIIGVPPTKPTKHTL